MRNLISLFAICMLFSCTDNEPDQKIDYFKMILSPPNPTTEDEIQIIHNHCNYEILTNLEFSGNTVRYVRQFNSSLMQPCKAENDTLIIGKFPKGNYQIIYELIDISDETLSNDFVFFREELFFEVF